MKTIGTYTIVNTLNGRIYFGSSVQVEARLKDHQNDLAKGKHCNVFLQNDYNKCGSEAFQFKILSEARDHNQALADEQVLLDCYYDKCVNCYNMIKTVAPAKGTWSHTPEETRAKLSAIHKGIKKSPEAIAKRSAARKGKKLSAEHIAKLSAAHKGKKHSLEHIAKMSASISLAKKGKKLSAEHIEKLRAIHKAKTVSAESRAKMSAAKKGKKLSPEHIAKMSASISAAKKGKPSKNKGKKASAETRAILIAAWVKRREAKDLLDSVVTLNDADIS